MATTKLFTAADLARMPDDERYELIRGELKPMSPVGKPHGRLLFRIGTPLSRHVDERDLGAVYGGDVGVILERDPDTVLAPDIAFVRGAPPTLNEEEEGYFVLVPDLAIEIASPSNSGQELREKVAHYLEAGVPAVWLFEPRPRTVTLFAANGAETVLTETDTLDGGEVVPGFRLPVADIFR